MNASKTAWQSVRMPRFAKLKSHVECDVLVVGGGITGLTAAYLLKQAGQRVCLVERNRLGGGDTGCTTAHLTYVTDSRISELAKTFGRNRARLAWEGGAAAINTIEEIVHKERIECQFGRVPGFLHASLKEGRDEITELKSDSRLANRLGFVAEFMDSVPHIAMPGVRFANQAKFHPMRYLAGLAQAVKGEGCSIFEESEAEEFEDQPLGVKINGKSVRCNYLVIATHVPLMGKAGLVGATLFQTKLAPYSSYAISGKIPAGTLPEASFWDTSDPYYYLRIDRGGRDDYAIFGGEDHKTGQAGDVKARFGRLIQMLRRIIPEVKVDCHWSAQVVETHDGLPYMVETAPKQFAATGFAGNGMTFGTLAAMMACDAALGRTNPWQNLFDVSRKPLITGAWDYIKENFDYPYYLVADRLKGADGHSTRDVKRGHGKVLTLEGKRVACSRDDTGKLTAVSAVCTHMGCLVRWNEGEGTWDCPCHGSRFLATGEVLAGPAEAPLEKVSLTPAKSATSRGEKQPRRRSGVGKKGR